jgi:hypothetical protein
VEPFSGGNLEDLKRTRSFSAFLHFVQEKATVGRNSHRFYGDILTIASCEWINQKPILAVWSFAHVDARLFLVRKTLAEKIATSGLLQGVIGFNGEEFPDASADEVAARCRI